MNYNNTPEAMLYLIRCALHGTPPPPLEQIDYEQLYQLSAFHSLTAMVAMALESGGLLTEAYADAACIQKWEEARDKAILSTVLLDTEREKILCYFEEQGIWYVPLKGILLKDLYPKLGMRQMVDNDILFDKAYQHQLKTYMESRGYQTISFQRGNHDVYQKFPVFNFEFHTSLFSDDRYSQWSVSVESPKEKLKKDPGNRFGYHFSDEDFYIHLLLHGHKHYQHGGGIGIRFLADIYVFLKEKQDSLDWEYVNRELAVLRVQTFEAEARALAQKMLDKNAPVCMTDADDMLCTIFRSGAYGTVSGGVQRALHNLQEENNLTLGKAKLRYVWSRVFPDKARIMQRYPFCRTHPWCIPVCWLLRLMRAVFLRGKYIWYEIKIFNKIK